MRGPIDFIVVGFEGKEFDGSILRTLIDAVDKRIIRVLALDVIHKDAEGRVTLVDVTQIDDTLVMELMHNANDSATRIGEDDINEVSELMKEDTAAALLIIEQLWALPLKQAIHDADGVLIAEGRIHPEAAKAVELRI